MTTMSYFLFHWYDVDIAFLWSNKFGGEITVQSNTAWRH